MLGRAVFVLCFLVGNAHAWVRERYCWQTAISPAEGATDVPLNAKGWIVGERNADGYHLRGGGDDRAVRGEEHDEILTFPFNGKLVSNTTYELMFYDLVLTRFTTGSTYDIQPPAAPRIGDIEYLKHKIDMHMLPDADSIATAIVVRPANEATVLLSTLAPPAGFTGQSAHSCGSMELAQFEGVKCFEARAIDIAGNVSPSVVRCTYDARAMVQQQTPSDHSNDRGVAVAFMLMGLCGLAFTITRGNAVRRTFATSRHFAKAELVQLQLLAHAQRKRTILFACACGAGLVGVSMLPIEVETQMALVVTPALLLTIAVIALCRLQLLLGLRPEPCLHVMSHGSYLYAARGNRLVGWVGATPRMMARASGLPTARARRV